MTDPEKSESAALRLLQSEGALLAAIPFAGSLVALAFEAGYLAFYDVPVTLIQIDFVLLVTSIAAITLFATTYFFIFATVAAFLKGSSPLLHALILPIGMIFFIFPFFYFSQASEDEWRMFVLLILLLVIINFVPPMLKRTSNTTYLDRLKSYLSSESIPNRAKETKSSLNKLEEKIRLPISILFYTVLLIFLIGKYHAAERSAHWVSKSDSTWLLVANYGDTIILKSFDPVKKQIGSDLRLIKVGDSSQIVFVKRALGTLRPARENYPK